MWNRPRARGHCHIDHGRRRGPRCSIAGLDLNSDTTGIENTIITEGETPSYANTFQGGNLISGLPIYEVSSDAASIDIPGADNFTGEINVRCWVAPPTSNVR